MELRVKKILLPFLLASVFLTHQVMAENKAFSLAKVEEYEKALTEELKKKNPSAKERQAIYNLAGRELHYLGYYDKADEYYKKSLEENVSVNKSEAYINRISVQFIKKDLVLLKERIAEARKYFNTNKKYFTADMEMYLNSMDEVANNKPSGKKPGMFSFYTSQMTFKDGVKNKEYTELLARFNVEKLAEADYDAAMRYDLVHVLARKKMVNHLFCSDKIKPYRDAFVPSVMICIVLEDYLKGEKITDDKLKRLEKYFKEIDDRDIYLLNAVKELL